MVYESANASVSVTITDLITFFIQFLSHSFMYRMRRKTFHTTIRWLFHMQTKNIHIHTCIYHQHYLRANCFFIFLNVFRFLPFSFCRRIYLKLSETESFRYVSHVCCYCCCDFILLFNGTQLESH